MPEALESRGLRLKREITKSSSGGCHQYKGGLEIEMCSVDCVDYIERIFTVLAESLGRLVTDRTKNQIKNKQKTPKIPCGYLLLGDPKVGETRT